MKRYIIEITRDVSFKIVPSDFRQPIFIRDFSKGEQVCVRIEKRVGDFADLQFEDGSFLVGISVSDFNQLQEC